MTIRELIAAADREPWLLAAFLLVAPVAAFLWGALHRDGEGGKSPWKWGYAVLVHLASVPGVLAAVLVAYSLFFVRENLLDANLLVYGLPIVAMVVTLVLIRRRVDFDAIPGFDRLSALILLMALGFGVALAILKTNVWLLFGSSIATLFAIALAVYALGTWATRRAFRPKGSR